MAFHSGKRQGPVLILSKEATKMEKPTITNDVLSVPIAYLLRRYKKDSGYKIAKKTYGRENLILSTLFDSDAYICTTIDKICDGIIDGGYRYPESGHVHAAFREVAPFMFKEFRNASDDAFIFEWLKKSYANVLGVSDASVSDASVSETLTEKRIRILKMIMLINPTACLKVKMEPRD
jgi:hypothetical protein